MRRLLLLAALLASGGTALANGRAPGTSTIHFRLGHESDIAAGMTFGLLFSHDNGVTWEWMCEDAIGYGGTYDPDYVYAASGTLFATTFNGVAADRDGCTFGPINSTVNFFSSITEAPNGKLIFAGAQTSTPTVPGNSGIYLSTDDGLTYSEPKGPGIPGDWWQSIEVAPSDSQRVYATGFRFVAGTKIVFSYRSQDGGETWEALPTTDFAVMPSSKLEIAGISATNPDLLYARVVLENNTTQDGIYKSADGGLHWTKLFSGQTRQQFLVRSTGALLRATTGMTLEQSTDQGATWAAVAGSPHVNCLTENSAHEVWACTLPALPTATPPGDGFGIMKSTDLATWTGVLKYVSIQRPVQCAVGTVQHDTCDRAADPLFGWCGLCRGLGCSEDATYSCTPPAVDGVPDASSDGGGDGAKDGHGCCSAGGGAPIGVLVLGAGVAVLLVTKRRRR